MLRYFLKSIKMFFLMVASMVTILRDIISLTMNSEDCLTIFLALLKFMLIWSYPFQYFG